MEKRGITITNYLANGDPEGVIYTYMSNWSGQAIKIPRNLFSKNKNLTELSRPGVYFLFGFNEENPDDKLVYIGESDKLNHRIAQHLKNPDKSFAETIICFSSKDENLTVSHTKYLEQKLIESSSKSGEYRLVNNTGGNSISLPKMVKDEMDTFYDNLTILLPTLGFSILNSISQDIINKEDEKENLLYFRIHNITAKALLTSNGIEVLKGSQVRNKTVPSLSDGYKNQRATLISKGLIIEKENKLFFNENIEFPSPSTAAAIIAGSSINGREAWKNKEGLSLKEIEEVEMGGF